MSKLNYQFERVPDQEQLILHMMDQADKYLSTIAIPRQNPEAAFVQIQAPEGMPHEILQSIEQMIQNRMSAQVFPRPELQGVVAIRLPDAYTIVFDLAKLWYEQSLEEVEDRIIDMMGLEEEFIPMDWAEEQFLDDPFDDKDIFGEK